MLPALYSDNAQQPRYSAAQPVLLLGKQNRLLTQSFTNDTHKLPHAEDAPKEQQYRTATHEAATLTVGAQPAVHSQQQNVSSRAAVQPPVIPPHTYTSQSLPSSPFIHVAQLLVYCRGCGCETLVQADRGG